MSGTPHKDMDLQEVNDSARPPIRAHVFGEPVWRRAGRNMLYLLVSGPLGLGYIILLLLGLILDLLLLGMYIVVSGSLVLAYSSVRGVLRLLLFSLHFLWIGTLALITSTIRALIRSFVSTGRAFVFILSIVIFAILHPRRAWKRLVRHRNRMRERLSTVRWQGMPRVWTAMTAIRIRRVRFPNVARSLKQLKRQVVPKRWIFGPVITWRLAGFERSLTMRWLGVDLPPLVRPQPAFGATRGYGQPVPSSEFPATLLGFLLAKLPIGLAALLLLFVVSRAAVWSLVSANAYRAAIWNNGIHIGALLNFAASSALAIAVVLVALYALYLHARMSRRFAQRAFSPSATVRRLLEAEALVAQERAKLEKIEQSRHDLIVNVSHELRTPTASIRAHVESLLIALDEPAGHGWEPETLRNYLGIVHREAERLGTLVDELLALARAEANELQLAITPVDTEEVIDEVHQALAPLARHERHVTLVYDVEPELPPVAADRQRLAQVLLNLVRNAIAYTPLGGIVSVTLRRADRGHLVLSVADTGSGIAPADLDRIFERFYRTDASRARSSGGFGLGLTIVRDLVEAMGGTVMVRSTLGEGSCFEVRLTIAAPAMLVTM